MGVVNDGNLLLVVRREEETEGLDELRHFYLKARLEIHRAGETGNVAVAGLVHRGDQGKERFPGGLELHGFLFLRKATAGVLGFNNEGCNGNDERILFQRNLNDLLAPLPFRLRASCHLEKRLWRALWGGEIPAKILSLLLPPNNKETLKPEAVASSCLRPPS